jgi:hypothetical protein
MTIEEFWNAAFLAALGRLPVAKAKKEADEATKACIAHWHANRFNWSPLNAPLMQDLNIAKCGKPADERGNAKLELFQLKTVNEPSNSIKPTNSVKKTKPRSTAKTSTKR